MCSIAEIVTDAEHKGFSLFCKEDLPRGTFIKRLHVVMTKQAGHTISIVKYNNSVSAVLRKHLTLLKIV